MTDDKLNALRTSNGGLTSLCGIRGLVHNTGRLRLQSSWKHLVYIAMPTVHASDGPAVDSPSTTIDLLADSRPKIVISESDIQAVLEKESGYDRIRAMYSKK